MIFTGFPKVGRRKFLQIAGCGTLPGPRWMLFYASIKASKRVHRSGVHSLFLSGTIMFLPDKFSYISSKKLFLSYWTGVKIADFYVSLSSKIFRDMNFSGIIVGAATFLIIGVCHPIVIKMEYYWGKGSWWLFLLAGLAFVAASIFVDNDVVATILGAAAFSCFWGIKEMFEQERRVLKGWFPENPARHDYYETIRKADRGGSTGSSTASAGHSTTHSGHPTASSGR